MIHNRDPWDRSNFHFHRTDPTPWIPIEEERDRWVFSKWAFVAVLLITVIAAVVFTTEANAETLAYTKNELGGKIVLTDTKCTSGVGSVAYSTNPRGQTLLGCWVYDDVFVHILWEGTVNPRAYGLENWHLTKGNVVPTM